MIGAAQRLMSVLAAAGVPHLNASITWHPPVWTGRKRPPVYPPSALPLGMRTYPNGYRVVKAAKNARRIFARLQSGKGSPSA
jgi:hypothetical protein